MQFLTTFLSALALAASTTTASPIAAPAPDPAAITARSEFIVFSPQITSPSQGVTWPVGSQQTVQWDTSAIPLEGRNNTGFILLGFNNGTESENLLVDQPLAHGFLLTAGSQIITIPKVPHRTTYFVVLFGDSGNKSPQFTITSSSS